MTLGWLVDLIGYKDVYDSVNTLKVRRSALRFLNCDVSDNGPNGTTDITAGGGVTLLMPPPNGVNDLPAFQALVTALTGVGGTIQFRSGLYKSPTGFQLTGVAGIHLRGVSSSVSGVPSTLLSWTGPRAANSACFRILACDSCSISHCGFVSTVSGPEYGCLIGGNGMSDADYCHVFDCQAYGNAAAQTFTTSATSINVSTCANTTVAITLASAAVPYAVGTQLMLCSRGGTGILRGVITASSGTAVSFIPTDAFGTGTHTDWDVLQLMNGFNVGSSELCSICRSTATLCYDSFRMGGVGGVVDASCTTSSPIGPSFRTGDASSFVKLFGDAEFNSSYGWTTALLIDDAGNVEASVGMGDGYNQGVPYVFRNIRAGDVHGLNATASGLSGASAMSVDTCSGLHIRSVYADCPSGFFVLNKGSNSDCSIDGLHAHTVMDTFSGGSAGFTAWFDVRSGLLNHDFLQVNHLTSKFGYSYPFGNCPLNNGANANVNLVVAVNLIINVTAAFQMSGAAPVSDGQLTDFVYLGTQPCTIQHNNAGSTAGNRFLCPGGADVVLTGPFRFQLLYSASAGAWLVNLPAQAPTLSGTVTLTAGVSAAIAAANLTANSRILVTLKTPSGTNLTVNYAALASDRSVGTPGSFKVTALLAAGTINTADASTLDWVVIG